MDSERFLRLTPRLFCELLKQERVRQRELAVQVALLRMDLINFSMVRPKRQVTLEDLLPKEAGRPRKVKPRRMTAKRRAAIAEALRRVYSSLPGVTFIPGH